MVEIGGTFAGKLEMLLLVMTHRNMGGSVVVMQCQNGCGRLVRIFTAVHTDAPKYPPLGVLDMRTVQASVWR